MSKEPKLFGSLPRGWRVEESDYDPDYQGSVGPLRRPDAASLRLARRNLREIPEKHIEGQGLHLVEKRSGQTWEVVTSLVDLVDTKSSGAEAFVIRDEWFVPLRPLGWKHERDESVAVGEVYGREARPKDPMPMPVAGMDIY
jgi:hypothetical protein